MRTRNFLLMLLMALFTVGCGKKEPTLLKVGAVLVMSGESAYWGQNLREGMELARNEINQNGGILGRQVEIVYEDSKGNPKDAVDAVNKLIASGNIECILGDAMSSNTLAMAPICERNKKILLNFCVAAELSHAGDFIFRNWNSAVLEAEFISSFCIQNSRKMVILFQNDSYGTSLKDEFIDRVKNKLKIDYTDAFNRGTPDFRSIISKFINHNYDGIYMPSYYEEGLKFLRQYKELNGKMVRVYGVSEWDQSTLKEFIKQNYPDLVFYPYPLPPDSTSPVRQKFVKDFLQKYKKQPEYLADNGYDAVYQIKYGIDKAGSYDASKIKDALYTMKDFQGASGVMSFDANGDVHKPYGLRTISLNGERWFEGK